MSGMIAHGEIATGEGSFCIADRRRIRTVHADAERATHGRVRGVDPAQPFGGTCIAPAPGLITRAAPYLSRHLVGNAGRQPVRNVPPSAQKMQFVPVPLALADDLLRGKDT